MEAATMTTTMTATTTTTPMTMTTKATILTTITTPTDDCQMKGLKQFNDVLIAFSTC